MNGPCIRCGREFTRPSNRGMCHACYMAWWSRRKGYGTFESLYTDAAPVRTHVIILRRHGLGLRKIAELAGINRKSLQNLLYGCSHRNTPPKRKMRKTTAEAILAIPLPDGPLSPLLTEGQHVDATGTRRKVRALAAFGHSISSLAARVGWTPQNFHKLTRDDTTQVTAKTARMVDALFRELQLVPGTNTRTRNLAKKKGWALPMEWEEDEIDDPSATPHITDPGKVSFDVRYSEMRDFLGLNDHEIARRMGLSIEALERQKYRYGFFVIPRDQEEAS